MAETKRDAFAAFDVFVETWGVKYDKAVECLSKIAMRYWPSTTSRPSTGNICTRATLSKARSTLTGRCARCVSNKTALAMIFKLAEAAEKSWRRLDGHNQLKSSSVQSSPTESRSSDRKLKPLPPDPFCHQNSAIARAVLVSAASGLIHSDDSQIGRSSSSSLYESRHCRDCHPNGSPSTRGDRRGPQRAAEACMARPHHPGDGRGLRYR